jgi:hypothetical protein
VRFSAHPGIPEGCFFVFVRFSAHPGIPGGYFFVFVRFFAHLFFICFNFIMFGVLFQ